MFSNAVNTDQLVHTRSLPEYMKKVCGEHFYDKYGNYDSTATSVMRMVADRFEGKDAHIYWASMALSENGNYDDREFLDNVPIDNNIAIVYMLCGSKKQWEMFTEYVGSHNRKTTRKMVLNKPYTRYCKGFGVDAMAYRLDSSNASIVYVHDDSMENWHFILSTLPSLFPRSFTTTLTPFEVKLFSSLTKKTSTEYEEVVKSYLENNDFKKSFIENLLSDFESRSACRQLSIAQQSYRSILDEISDQESYVRRLYKRREEQQTFILGLEARVHGQCETEGNLAKFFIANKRLELVRTGERESSITFVARTYLSNFNPDMYEKYRENKSSIFNRFEFRHANMNWLLDQIFLEETIKVKMQTGFYLNFENLGYNVRHEDEIYLRYEGLRNPHLEYFNCFGDNGRYLSEAMGNQDCEYAVSQCIVCAGSLNLAETITVEKFLRDLDKSTAAVLEYNGKGYSLEAILDMHEKGEI